VRVEHPTPEREAEIIASRTPKADETFHREMAGIALSFRNYSLEKPPSVSEMIDFANALQLLGTDHVTARVPATPICTSGALRGFRWRVWSLPSIPRCTAILTRRLA